MNQSESYKIQLTSLVASQQLAELLDTDSETTIEVLGNTFSFDSDLCAGTLTIILDQNDAERRSKFEKLVSKTNGASIISEDSE